MKKSAIFHGALGSMLLAGVSTADILQGGGSNPGSSGSMVYCLYPGATALLGKTIDNSFYKPSWSPGKVLHNVNMLTGQPEYSVPIAEIAAGEVARFPIGFQYSGSVRAMYAADNEAGPTSWIGYGWSFRAPFIAVNHRGTVTRDDDIYFCDLGQYGSGQFLQALSGKYYLSTNPVANVMGPIEENGRIVQWIVELPGGVRMTFGKDGARYDAIRHFNRVGDQLTGSPYTVETGDKFSYRWDLSRLEDFRTLQGTTNQALFFTYDRYDVALGAAGINKYTRESYLKEIIAKNTDGNEVERYRFFLGDRTPAEYAVSGTEPELGQTLFETKFLQQIEKYADGNSAATRQWILNHNESSPVQPAAHPNFPYPKRFLRNLQMTYRNPVGNYVAEPRRRWGFTYDASFHYSLSTINKPMQGVDEFSYARIDFTSPGFATRTSQGTTRQIMTDKLGGTPPPQIVLPTEYTELSTKWKNKTQCSEKFCYIAVLQKVPPSGAAFPILEKLHLTVWKNNGNYFKMAEAQGGIVLDVTVSSIYNKSLQVIPWNDNFIFADKSAKTFTLYEWTGDNFVTHDNILRRNYNNGAVVPAIPSSAYFEDPEAVNDYQHSFLLGSDFFAVHDYNFADCQGNVAPRVRIWVVKKVNGVWKDINETECSVIGNADCNVAWNAAGKRGSDGCMDFDHPTVATVSQNFLNVAAYMNWPNKLFTWVRDRSTIGFKQIESISFDRDWLGQPPIFGKDYYAYTYSEGGGGSLVGIVKHFDGNTFQKIPAIGSSDTAFLREPLNRDTRIIPNGDYFLLVSDADPVYRIYYKTVTKNASGNPTGIALDKKTFFTLDQTLAGNVVSRIKTHPNAFTMDILYKDWSKDWSRIDELMAAPVNFGGYLSRLYEFDKGLLASTGSPIREVGGDFLDPQGFRYFDITFSPDDNLVTGRSCKNSLNQVCVMNLNEPQTTGFATAVMTPRLGTVQPTQPFLRKKRAIFDIWPANATSHFHQYKISGSSRMLAITRLNRNSGRAEYALMQSMGDGFTQYPFTDPASSPPTGDFALVRSFKSKSDISGPTWGHFVEHRFSYVPEEFSLLDERPEFNSHLRTFLFPSSAVRTYKGSAAQTDPKAEGAETVKHLIDVAEAPIPEPHMMQQGLVKSVRTHDLDGLKSNVSLPSAAERKRIENDYYPPYRESSWPDKLFVVRPKSLRTTDFARGGTYRSKFMTFHCYNATNNQMSMAKYQLGNGWHLDQTLFAAAGVVQGLPIGSASFRFTSEPSDASLDAWASPGQIYSTGGASAKVVSASRIEFNNVTPFVLKKSVVWQDEDNTLDDGERKLGVEPIREIDVGWKDQAVVEKLNKLGQPLEVSTMWNETPKVVRSTALFYEGRGSLSVGRVENAKLSDAAILACENGSASLTNHDWEGRWTRADAGYSGSVAHSGRWSVKVVDNYGPTTELKLADAKEQGYGYTVSAWIYSENSNKPVLSVQRFRSNGTGLNTLTTSDPVGEAFAAKKWQRYEISLSNAGLRGSENLFDTPTSGDFLKVRVGTGAPASNSSRIAYVDDIVCRPTQTIASLQAYDAEGRVTHSMDNDYRTFQHEYDVFGNPTAIRDEESRITSFQSTHLPGEND